MADSKTRSTRAQLKKSLSILKAKGLYKPKEPRKAPTEYGARLARRYADVVAGKAFVVKADKSQIQKFAGQGFKTKGDRVVVSKDTFTDKVRYNKKTKELVSYKKTRSGVSYKFTRANVTRLEDLPKLKKGQTYAVPFRQGRLIEFQTRASIEELQALINQYEKRDAKKNRDADEIIANILIGTRVSKRDDDDEADDE